MRVKSWVLAAAAAGALTLGACGDDGEDAATGASEASGDQAAAAAAANEFLTATVAGDGEAACALLTDKATATIEESATGVGEDASCAELVGLADDLLDSDDVEQIEAEIAENPPTTTSVEGESAIVETPTFNKPDENSEIEISQTELGLELVDGEWKIASFEDPR